MSVRVSEYLEVVGGRTTCRNCGYDLGPAEENWKAGAVLKERPMDGAAGDPYRSGDHVRLRLFFCPGCARQLGTETAVEGDPFLEDVVTGS